MQIRPMILAAAGLAACAATILAGDINPPAGPVSPTMKPLTDVEPRIVLSAASAPGDADSTFKITQPGSYYLTGNITGEVGKHGIEVAVNGVTIDLMGFRLTGVTGALDGIRTTVTNGDSLRIVNGQIASWPGDGINTQPAFTRGVTLEGVTATSNGGMGIRVYNGVVSRCTAQRNGQSGFLASFGGTFTTCVSSDNLGDGFSVITGCTVRSCSASANAGDGIQASDSCVVRDNTCSLNGQGAGIGAGISLVSSRNCVEGNVCTGADRGISTTNTGNFIAKNTCSGNTTNFEVAAGNVCLVVAGATCPAISGNSGGASAGSTDPNANYAY